MMRRKVFNDQIVINLSRSNYDIIKQVVRKETNWKIQLDDNFYQAEWDLFW